MQRLVRPVEDGIQILIRFRNNHGASIICTRWSYGGSRRKFELAHVKFKNKNWNSFRLVYDEIVNYDVVGWLNPDEVSPYLCEIARIKEQRHVRRTA